MTDSAVTPEAEASQPSHPIRPELDRLVATVARFRGEGGCAWYENQTHESLVTYLIEESAELVEAIESGNQADIREELGDVLFQVLFHSDVAAQHPDEPFDLEDVARDQTEKLVRRNPHVFGPNPTRDIDEIIALWQEAKAIEKRDRTSVLDGVPFGMPSLALADKVIGKAAQVDVRVTAAASVADAVTESEQALGEELLALVAAARERGLDAERALRGAIRNLTAEVRRAEAGE